MRLRKTLYYYSTVSYDLGSNTIEIDLAQYNELIKQFEDKIALSNKEFEEGKTNKHLKGVWNELDFDAYNETRFYISVEGTTHILIKKECKQGYSFGDYN